MKQRFSQNKRLQFETNALILGGFGATGPRKHCARLLESVAVRTSLSKARLPAELSAELPSPTMLAGLLNELRMA